MEGTKRATCWSITINNPEKADYDATKNISGWKDFVTFKGQNEVGENGTPHIQGMLITKSVKFSVVKKHFPRAHIEIAKSQGALEKYVTKEQTRVSTIASVKVASVGNLNRAVLEYFPTNVWGPQFGLTEHGHREAYAQAIIDSCQSRETAGLEILDDLTRYLMRLGYYGIEYISANPSVRATWKKYIRDILYREYARSTQEPEAQTESSAPPQTQDDQDEVNEFK